MKLTCGDNWTWTFRIKGLFEISKYTVIKPFYNTSYAVYITVAVYS